MNPGRTLRKARQRAGLTQRALAKATGVAQPTIARIETGDEVPRVDTLSRLLSACGERLEAFPRGGEGVDRTLIHDMLRRTPAERLDAIEQRSRAMGDLLAVTRPVKQSR